MTVRCVDDIWFGRSCSLFTANWVDSFAKRSTHWQHWSATIDFKRKLFRLVNRSAVGEIKGPHQSSPQHNSNRADHSPTTAEWLKLHKLIYYLQLINVTAVRAGVRPVGCLGEKERRWWLAITGCDGIDSNVLTEAVASPSVGQHLHLESSKQPQN